VKRRAPGLTSARQLYNYLRDYDPQIGRYVESDPMGLVAGVGTFTYAVNNPISLIDPLGLTQQDINEMVCFARLKNPDLNIPNPNVEHNLVDEFGQPLLGAVGPWPWSQVEISDVYLEPLDATGLINLYNTIVHESWHWDKQPFWNRWDAYHELEARTIADLRTKTVQDLIKRGAIDPCKCRNQ